MISNEERITNKKRLKEYLRYETLKYGVRGGVIRNIFPISENDVLRKHQIILRKTEFHVNTNHFIRAIIYRAVLLRIQNKYALHVPINTVGKGLKIMHVGPVLINGRATVGEDCSIHINTSLVAGGSKDDVPTIGKRCVIGVGAVVIGGVNIADDTIIGANAVVTKSIEEGKITIAGIPAKVLSKKH